jgi:hypothetical protein
MATASVVQKAYRFRNDNGNETGATWIAAANTPISKNVDETFRLRFVVGEVNNKNDSNGRVLYASYSGGSYFPVTTSSNYVKLVNSSFVADDAATTQQLGTLTFVTGQFDSNGSVGLISLWNTETEYEYCIQIDGNTVFNGNTISFRVYTSGGTPLNVYTVTPSLTVIKTTTITHEGAAAIATSSDLTVSGSVAHPTHEGISDISVSSELSV